MGYQTYFNGEIAITPKVEQKHIDYINTFSGTRRMKRNAELTKERYDAIREAVGLPVGEEGCYFVGEGGFAGQGEGGIGGSRPEDVVDYNLPPAGQPGLWCQWEISDSALTWDEGEKFYNYVEWMEYLIEHFFAPWGYKLEGEISWSGEEDDDRGVIYVQDNKVEAVADTISNDGPSWA